MYMKTCMPYIQIAKIKNKRYKQPGTEKRRKTFQEQSRDTQLLVLRFWQPRQNGNMNDYIALHI